ncbi:MAG: cell division protein FtsQ/DivIB [Thermoleophilia bacterium]
MSGARTTPAGGGRGRAHPAVMARRRQISRERGARRRGGLILLLCIAAAVCGAYWIATGPPTAIQGVTVEGYDRPDRDLFLKAMGVTAAQGTIVSPPSMDIQRVAHRFPWVDRITISRDWPRDLKIAVVLARPAAVVSGTNGAMLVTADGRVLGPAPGNAVLGALRIAGPVPDPGATLDDDARALVAFIATAKPKVAVRIRYLGVDATGEVSARLLNGPQLRLGLPERMPAKAIVLGLMLNKLTAEEQAQATYIDLSDPEHPAAGGLEPVSTSDGELATAEG